LLKKVGSSKKEVMNNGVLDDGQQQELLRLAMAESMAWLRKEFKDVAMSRNQWMALASMAYNSRWNERGPTLIGPNLTRFIKDGDWQGAADEIRNRSNATKNRGLQIRREAEADMFLGTHPDLDPSELPTS
jgi:GH24 family phage-related lysozyme (muramidase)